MVTKKKVKYTHLVKRRGKMEKYDEKKVYGSSYFACKTVNMDEKKCEKISEKVAKSTTKWVKKQDIVTSDMIFKFVAKELRKHDDDAAFMFATHRDVN